MIVNYLILAITIINLVILLSVSNLLIRTADVLRNLNKNIDEYFYLEATKPSVKNNQNQEKGLVDI